MIVNKKIYFIDEEEDTIDLMAKAAASASDEENLKRFFKHLSFSFALSGINIHRLPENKSICFLEDKDSGN